VETFPEKVEKFPIFPRPWKNWKNWKKLHFFAFNDFRNNNKEMFIF